MIPVVKHLLSISIKNRAVFWCLFALLGLIGLSGAQEVYGAEGGVDYYMQGGVYGNFGIAKLPGPGVYYLNYLVYQNGKVDEAVRGGRLHVDIEDDIGANAFAPVYISDWKLFGGNYVIGAALVYMGASMDAGIIENVGNDIDASNWGWADPTIVPFGLSWQGETWDFFLYELINVPIGEYDKDNDVNLGFNYWAFDTNLAITGELPANFEIDANLGYLINSKNHATNYHSGSAGHIDATLGYNVTPQFQVGLSGYYYNQVQGDSGSGAILGDFKGEAYGWGPTVQYIFNLKPIIVLNFEWQHDTYAKNRMKNDTGVFFFAFEF
jgi:hypothetical protein